MPIHGGPWRAVALVTITTLTLPIGNTVAQAATVPISVSISVPAEVTPQLDTNPGPISPRVPAATSATEVTPVPASRTRKARHVPAYPSISKQKGKRIVYDKQLMTIWLIDKGERVVARYPVVGRTDRPAAGVYRVYSKSPSSANREQKLTFRNMVRFARGPNTGAAIGFHDIPRTYDGRRIHGEDVLGLPLGQGGCVRMSDKASNAVYAFAQVGTVVEVIS